MGGTWYHFWLKTVDITGQCAAGFAQEAFGNQHGDINSLAQDCSKSITNTLELLQDYSKPLIYLDIIGLVQDCSNSSVLAMDLLQSCAKLSI